MNVGSFCFALIAGMDISAAIHQLADRRPWRAAFYLASASAFSVLAWLV